MAESDKRIPGFPILAVFRLKGQPKRDGNIIFRSCKASQSPVYPIRDAVLAVNYATCPSSSSSGPRQWGESGLALVDVGTPGRVARGGPWSIGVEAKP